MQLTEQRASRTCVHALFTAILFRPADQIPYILSISVGVVIVAVLLTTISELITIVHTFSGLL